MSRCSRFFGDDLGSGTRWKQTSTGAASTTAQSSLTSPHRLQDLRPERGQARRVGAVDDDFLHVHHDRHPIDAGRGPVRRNRHHDTLWMDLYGADMTLVAPYGSWPSIVTAADVVAGDSTPTALHAAEGVRLVE